MAQIFQILFYQPILNVLIWLYNVLPGNDIGIAIIALTFIVKGILWPFTAQQIKQQRAMQLLQPKVDEIRKRLKDDKDAQAKELMELYKKDKVNPASSCLPLLIQLPVFWGLFRALRDGLAGRSLQLLYPFVAHPAAVNPIFLGLMDLSKPNYILAVLAGAIQFVQSWQIMRRPALTTEPPKELRDKKGAKDEDMSAIMNKQMMYIMPIVTVFIGISLPGGLTLYWLTMSLLMVVQQTLFLRKPTPPTTPQIAPPTPSQG